MQLDSCVYPDQAKKKYSVFPNGMQCFQKRASQMSCVPERDTQRCSEKILILNPNFSRHFKKILNGQKLDNLCIFQLLKFGGDSSKIVMHFCFVF